METPPFSSEHLENESITLSISPSFQAFCATLTTWGGAVVTPQELVQDFLLCLEHQYSRPGSWEAALGREFLGSYGYTRKDDF